MSRSRLTLMILRPGPSSHRVDAAFLLPMRGAFFPFSLYGTRSSEVRLGAFMKRMMGNIFSWHCIWAFYYLFYFYFGIAPATVTTTGANLFACVFCVYVVHIGFRRAVSHSSVEGSPLGAGSAHGGSCGGGWISVFV